MNLNCFLWRQRAWIVFEMELRAFSREYIETSPGFAQLVGENLL
jgi:hypothetical protein